MIPCQLIIPSPSSGHLNVGVVNNSGDISGGKIMKDLKLQCNELTLYFDLMGIP